MAITVKYNLTYKDFCLTLAHEYVHYCDDVRSNGNANKKGKLQTISAYYNSTCEINAHISTEIPKPTLNNINSHEWFTKLTTKNKKKVIGRIYTDRVLKIN
jgi:hypothetical protein